MNIEDMDMTGTFTGKSIEEAKQKAADEFNAEIENISFRIINDTKKSLFGKIKEEAKVFAGYNNPVSEKNDEEIKEKIENTDDLDNSLNIQNEEPVSDEQAQFCCDYLKRVLDKMEIEADVNMQIKDNVICIEIDSKGSGAVIGRRGETLDALQYLVSLVVNKFPGDYKRVSIDSCGYRAKREETLITLANKIGQKALRTGRSTTLEPMNPYERRIIHSTISKIEGVNSKSVGEEPYRKVVISSDHPKKNDGKRNGGYKKRRGDGPRSLDLKTSFEKDYKKPKPEDNINAGLYGKIEL